MGVDPQASVTTPNARFHHVLNAYAIGPALVPTMGSPNPMLTGVALARRLAEHLVAALPAPTIEADFTPLFDGAQAMFDRWRYVGPGGFNYESGEGVMVAQPDGDIGLLYWPETTFGDFLLRLQFRLDAHGDNSGVFVRFHDPLNPPAGLGDSRAVGNPAWVAVDTGFEAQIDDLARPDGADAHRTGAIYEGDPATLSYHRGSTLQPGEWNDYEIEVSGNAYTVRLNGFETSAFLNNDPNRGLHRAPSVCRRTPGESHSGPSESRPELGRRRRRCACST